MTIRTNPAVSFPKVFRYVLRIYVQRSADIGVPQQFLLHLHVNPQVTQHGRVRMPERVPTNARA